MTETRWMFVLNLAHFFTRLYREGGRAANSKLTYIWTPSSRSYIVFALACVAKTCGVHFEIENSTLWGNKICQIWMNLAYSEYQNLDAFYNLFARFGSLIYIRKHMSGKNEWSYYENWGCKLVCILMLLYMMKLYKGRLKKA